LQHIILNDNAIKIVWPKIIDELEKVDLIAAKALGFCDVNKFLIDYDKKILVIKCVRSYKSLVEKENIILIINKVIKDNTDFDLKVIISYYDETDKHLDENMNSIFADNNSYKQKKTIDNINNKKRNFNEIKINNSLSESNFFDLSKELMINQKILILGKIFSSDIRQLKNDLLLFTFEVFDISHKRNSICVKFFLNSENKQIDDLKELIKIDNELIIFGSIREDRYTKDKILFAFEIKKPVIKNDREDLLKEKRVELHAHTRLSSMDAISSPEKLILQAKNFGHNAITITDHGVVQAFPEAMLVAKKNNIKVIYGCEIYLIDDLESIVRDAGNKNLDNDFVVIDIETTGLSKDENKIIEIGAVKIKDGKIKDKFSTLINPEINLEKKIIELTGINDEMLLDAPKIDNIFPEFLNFIDDCILVAHNADFDVGFIYKLAKNFNIKLDNAILDTLNLARILLPDLARYKLNYVADFLKVDLNNHHRALDDATATAEIFLKFREILKSRNIFLLRDVNSIASNKINKNTKFFHACLLVKNMIGLKNLYKLISISHLDYFYKRPRIPKSEFLKYRDGLIISSGCSLGELFVAIVENNSQTRITEIIKFYDYFEVQPIENNFFMIRDKTVNSKDDLIDINKKIINLAKDNNKLVVATGDVHFLNPEDEIYRRIIMSGDGFKDAEYQPPLYLRTTQEMLDEFNYLDKELAHEIVIKNTNLICNKIKKIKPVPDGTFSPKIEDAEEKIKHLTYKNAYKIYGYKLPEIIRSRLEKELNSIIKNGFAGMYLVAQELVKRSNDAGYLVGSRGSVGSSLVATMIGITEVNPLAPYYICDSCKYFECDSFEIKKLEIGSGYDLPDKICPSCGKKLNKDGHDIPFETFLGFDGDKEPDIDLNFSGEYQLRAHAHAEEIFGSKHVFKSGTISTLAENTAYGYVKKYYEEKNINLNRAETNRLKLGCTGIKKTTGQHPGGLMIVPENKEIFEFTPIQRPANDTKSNITTTHFDYHSLSGRLLKLDLLGHDVPTIIYMLEKNTGIDSRKISLSDKKILSLFYSSEILGKISHNLGTLGLPEFGTKFVQQMLVDTNPRTFSELVRICGLSHGTDVWFNNAHEIIKNNIADLKSIIPSRDDIMIFLISNGIEKKMAFRIMESVRKGHGISREESKILKENNIPEWYINSCNKIKYLFPKAHAVAYVIMTVRIGYFKIYEPYAFYAAIFSMRVGEFDYKFIDSSYSKNFLKELNSKKELSFRERSIISLLEIIEEFFDRNLKFLEIDLYKSDAKKFIICEEGLLPPLCTLEGLGDSVSEQIIVERNIKKFTTVEDFKTRTKSNKNVINLLKENKILKNLPETNQLSFL
jgi:DNA polymerase-3 subunit alpha (Gram-positive type)